MLLVSPLRGPARSLLYAPRRRVDAFSDASFCRCMGKSLNNFLKDREKFSPKKQRQPIHEYPKTMKWCPLHDGDGHRSCIGPGCKKFDAKHGGQGGAWPIAGAFLRSAFPPAACVCPSR